MTVYSLLASSEILLEGKWIKIGGVVTADNTSCRIEFLINNVLLQVATDDSGWLILYKDPRDGRFWELSYPDSGAHGGGAPALKCLNIDEVKRKYTVV